MIRGTRIVLGVTGGIAAYKTAELVRLFRKAGADVRVVMTPNATQFVTPLTLGTLSENEVVSELFPVTEKGTWTKHVELGLWGDLFVIAPLTAQTLAKLAGGLCDSMVTAVALTARCPILVCPAMDHDMYEHPATGENLETLRSRGIHVMDAAVGELASGLTGVGRLPEPEEIFERSIAVIAESVEQKAGLMAGIRVLVSAGPTREALDPVRFLSNRSSGTMGYEIAAAAARRGADVELVSGPTALDCPEGVLRTDVLSTEEMNDAMIARSDADYIFMVAAVADFRPAVVSDSKIKKQSGDTSLQLIPTVDILAGLGARRSKNQVLIGFALETEDGRANAAGKLESKHLDWIVLNDPTQEGAGFGPGTNRVTLIGRDGSVEELPVMKKREVAEALLDRVATRA